MLGNLFQQMYTVVDTAIVGRGVGLDALAALMKAMGDTTYLYLVYMAVFLPVLYLLYVYQAALNGTGNTMASVVSGVIQLFLRVGIAMIVGMIGCENGICSVHKPLISAQGSFSR